MENIVRTMLDTLIRESGSNYSEVSRLLGRNAAYIQQFIKRGSPRKLEEEDRYVLARYFGVDENVLVAGTETGHERLYIGGNTNHIIPRAWFKNLRSSSQRPHRQVQDGAGDMPDFDAGRLDTAEDCVRILEAVLGCIDEKISQQAQGNASIAAAHIQHAIDLLNESEALES
ncbi:MAG: hypothetical protein AB7E60_01965 [Sphingobium sp.]